jgi:hypothetical protein
MSFFVSSRLRHAPYNYGCDGGTSSNLTSNCRRCCEVTARLLAPRMTVLTA